MEEFQQHLAPLASCQGAYEEDDGMAMTEMMVQIGTGVEHLAIDRIGYHKLDARHILPGVAAYSYDARGPGSFPEFGRRDGQVPEPPLPGGGVDRFAQGRPVQCSHYRTAGMPNQCVVAMGVDDVEAAEILDGVAPCKLPGPQPSAQGV